MELTDILVLGVVAVGGLLLLQHFTGATSDDYGWL
jgi:hypothetical protein